MLATELELSGFTELMPLCDFDKLFVEKLSQYDGTGSVLDYMDGVELIYSQQYDLNGDGRLDWLFALSHPTLFSQAYIEVWAVLLTEMGIEVEKLPAYLGAEEDIEEISAEIHFLPSFDTPLIAILSNNRFNLLQLVKEEAEWETKLYINFAIATDYSLQMVEDNLQLDLIIDPPTGIDRITYQWDVEMDKFVEVSRHASNSLGVPFYEALDSAETLILENGDLAAAISILNTIANEYEPIDDAWWQTTLPKTLYLLGLAHEIEGNEEQAVAVYWRLWHEYPISPYALMAAAKLEETT
jgi:hypothetical protein